jgi:hypothetical protein
VAKLARALRPGGAFVSHEYFEYGTWRLVPPESSLDRFVQLVIAAWRESGGEPNVGLEIPSWCEAEGMTIASLAPLVDVIDASQPSWQWPRSFIESGLARLVDLSRLSPQESAAIWQAFLSRETAPQARMITPAVLEVIAIGS